MYQLNCEACELQIPEKEATTYIKVHINPIWIEHVKIICSSCLKEKKLKK
ncbi:hypothetical protein HZA98_04880 [Candidatus Woesearchaeota archaeon]|nr:hypothetical protein [Candidatus Woesearchaeota archaeon]